MGQQLLKTPAPLHSRPDELATIHRRLTQVGVTLALENTDAVDAEHGEPCDPALHTEALAFDARLQAGDDAQPAPVAGVNIEH